MKFFDLLSLVLDNLGRRKARVALTAVGVIIGTAAVVLLVSLGIGLQRNATDQLLGIGDLTRIDVYPSFGGDGGQIMAVSSGPGGGPQPRTILGEDALDAIRQLPGVEAAVPHEYLMASA